MAKEGKQDTNWSAIVSWRPQWSWPTCCASSSFRAISLMRDARHTGHGWVVTVGLLVLVQLAAGGQTRDPVAIPTEPFTPVTDAMLEDPDPADWLHWRRTLDAWGYSPLNEINQENAHRLQLTWSRTMRSAGRLGSPIVHDGVMYIPEPLGVVQAVDAATGDLLWDYQKQFEVPPGGGFRRTTRSLAIYGDKLFVTTSDAHIVALDAQTGRVVWDHMVADYKLGYRYSSGPLVVRGKIVAGVTGCERYKDDVCFISAHDPETGTELWRTPTIARPGDPGGETWGDLPLNRRAGGDAWIPGSYDPATNLIYWATAQAKPWARVSRETDGDALYTNSVLALDPDTGEMVWFKQLIPGETHDLDEVYESVLIDHLGQRSLFKIGKLGILWEIDRRTGQLLAAHDLGYQTLVDVDLETGRVTYRPGTIPEVGVEIGYCPGSGGIRNVPSSAYHPGTQALYIPIHPSCGRFVFSEVKKDNLGTDVPYYALPAYTGRRVLETTRHPTSPEHGGQLIAMDITTGDVLWRHLTRARPASAALTTGGGLVTSADAEHLYLHDVENGRVLFHTRLPSPVSGFPITYAVDGQQHLAVPVTSDPSVMFVFALPKE